MIQMWPLVSVVIPHCGGYKILSECLLSLEKSEYQNLEVIVVDNASLDNSIYKIKKNFSDVKILKSEYNRGFASGCNFGVEHALGEFILILNNDTVHKKHWIDLLVKKINSDSKISSVQPKIKNFQRNEYFDYAGASGGFIDKYGFPFSRGRIFNTIEKDLGQYDNACQIFWASGTAFLTRKNIFNKIGGFDETFFAHMEEIDYHWKCQLLGYKIWVEPESEIYHHGGFTLPSSSPKKTYLNYRNSLIVFMTNNNFKLVIKLILFRLILDMIAFLKELIVLKWMHSLAIIKSWIWVFFHPYILFKRKLLIKKISKKSNVDGIFQKSIVLEYFFKRKVYYNQIKK